MKDKFEITKQQAKLFLQLLNIVRSIPSESNMLSNRIGNIQVGLLDTYILEKSLKEFICI